MAKPPERSSGKPHEHVAVTRYTLRQLNGLPYEVERTVCERCGQTLDQRPLRRAAA